MCGLLTSDGFWSQAQKDAGFGAVANILKAREKRNYNEAKDYTEYNFKMHWTRGDEKSHSLEVFLQNGQGTKGPFATPLGTCFSTQPCN